MQAGISNAGYTNGVGFMGGVGSIRGSTIPGNSNPGAETSGASAAANAGTYSGPLAARSFVGEPFAVWLGMILILVLLKFLTEHPSAKILGHNVNPAHIRIGGYNFLAIGVSASIFLVMFKVLVNRYKVPGLTEFGNAL